jgi:hypothetical protein
MASHDSLDGLSTVGELRTSSYIWFISVFILSASMVSFFYKVDSKLYTTKNKWVEPADHKENRLSASTLPNTNHDARGKSEFTDAVGFITK